MSKLAKVKVRYKGTLRKVYFPILRRFVEFGQIVTIDSKHLKNLPSANWELVKIVAKPAAKPTPKPAAKPAAVKNKSKSKQLTF